MHSQLTIQGEPTQHTSGKRVCVQLLTMKQFSKVVLPRPEVCEICETYLAGGNNNNDITANNNDDDDDERMQSGSPNRCSVRIRIGCDGFS